MVVWKHDLYIQEANRQLSDDRFYQRLDADPIQQDQKIVKNTIKDMIASCELPPTAKHLLVTTPRTSRFYVTQDSQTEQPLDVPLFLHAAAPPRTSQCTLRR